MPIACKLELMFRNVKYFLVLLLSVPTNQLANRPKVANTGLSQSPGPMANANPRVT